MTLPTGRVSEQFGGEERAFLVRIGQLREIQKKCGAGPAAIAGRLARCVNLRQARPQATILELAALGLGEWTVDDVREPILQGLVAAGMPANDAGGLLKTWVDDRGFAGLLDHVELAFLLIVAGVEAEPDQGETTAAKTKARTGKTRSRKSTSPLSTAPADG